MLNELDACAIRLLNFIDQSVEEALARSGSMLETLSEADATLRILSRILNAEDAFRFTELTLIDVFNVSFVQIAKDNMPDPTDKMKEALATVMRAKPYFKMIC